ncbi:MAG: hypothetical protein ABFS18_00495 [Thermodesulfobacteriota bacterium]
MKYFFIILFTVLSVFSLWPTQPESQVYAGQFFDQWKSFQRTIELSFKSEQDIKELLSNKKAEQQVYVDTLEKIDETIAQMESEVGICEITGLPNEFILEEDPRPEIQAKIDKLEEEIRLLENNS